MSISESNLSKKYTVRGRKKESLILYRASRKTTCMELVEFDLNLEK